MNRYPFDIQECNGTIEPKTNSDFFVKLVPKFLDYLGPTDLMKYHMNENATFIKTDNVFFSHIHFKNNLVQEYIFLTASKLARGPRNFFDGSDSLKI